MKEEKENNKSNKNSKIKYIIFAIFIVILVVFLSVIIWYNVELNSISKESNQIKVSIELNTSIDKIAKTLEDKKLIKNAQVFKIYTRLNNVSNFQAGEYTLDQNMTVPEIAEALQSGVVYGKNRISITFLEGKTINWYAKKIAENTNNTENDVYKLLTDEEYIDSLIDKYWFLSNDIKNEDIYYSLEGYLCADTYMFENKNVTVKEIFKTLLDGTEKVLNEFKNEIDNSNYSVHKLITMASIIEMEGINSTDKKDISSVFYNRLQANMSLGSDVTAYYGAKVEVGERDLTVDELNSSNPYNTRNVRMKGQLPVGPISSASKTSIEAALNPNKTDYLYFVADKDGKIYFSKTYQEHTKIVNDLKKQGLWYEFE